MNWEELFREYCKKKNLTLKVSKYKIDHRHLTVLAFKRNDKDETPFINIVLAETSKVKLNDQLILKNIDPEILDIIESQGYITKGEYLASELSPEIVQQLIDLTPEVAVKIMTPVSQIETVEFEFKARDTVLVLRPVEKIIHVSYDFLRNLEFLPDREKRLVREIFKVLDLKGWSTDDSNLTIDSWLDL